MEAEMKQERANSIDKGAASLALVLGLANLLWPALQLAGMQVNADPVWRTIALVAVFLALGLGITGVILGVVALGRIRREPARYAGTPRAAVGIILNLLVLAMTAALLFLGWIMVGH